MSNEDDTAQLPPEVLAARDELLALRRDVDAAEARLLNRAAEIEQEISADVWKGYWGSYDAFLKKANIIDPARYRSYLAALETPGVAEQASKTGVSAAIQAGKIVDEERRGVYLTAARVRFEETGVPWSDEEAQRQRVRIGGGPGRDSNWNSVGSEKERLRKENVELKAKLQQAEREIAELQEENERLRKGTQKKGRSRPEDRPRA